MVVAAPCIDERAYAEETLARIEREWPLRRGDAVTSYVQGLGARLADHTARKRWRFLVVRDLAPNAFTIGGGYVLVTDGAVNFVRSESELAAILAHELGHELAGHFCRPADSPETDDFFDLFSPREIGSPNIGIGSLTLTVDAAKEREADQHALSILYRSGYDPRALLHVARRLPASGGAVHLVDTQRLRALDRSAGGFPPVAVSPSKEFDAIKRLLAREIGGP